MGWFAPESEGDFWFVFTGSSLPIALHECPILQNRTLLQPAMSQSISSLSISGYAFSDSHFEIACRETPSSIASCSCVMLREPRRYCRFSFETHVRPFVEFPYRLDLRLLAIAKQQLVINVAFHATIFRLHCDSQPNFATQPTVARREVDFTGLLRQ